MFCVLVNFVVVFICFNNMYFNQCIVFFLVLVLVILIHQVKLN